MAAAKFDYHAPSSVEEALALLNSSEDAKILAGGHSLIPMMKTGLAAPAALIDLGKTAGLSYVNESDGALAIGAMTTYSELATSDTVAANAAVLGEAAASVADPQVRNMGTIGGSLSHADPAGDLPAVAIALNARLITSSTGEHRTLSIDDFFVDLLTTALAPNEILNEIAIPALPARSGSGYAKFANKASHYAIVGIAAVVGLDANGVCEHASIGVTGAGPVASRASEAEAALRGSRLDDAAVSAAAAAAGAGIDFLEDLHASAEYRAHLTSVFAARAIRQAAARAG
jgi:carbon-monoxide dehydrogenase medium subunit